MFGHRLSALFFMLAGALLALVLPLGNQDPLLNVHPADRKFYSRK